MTGYCGVSSTPRLFGFIASASGILDHPHSRVTTTLRMLRSRADSGIRNSFFTIFIDRMFTSFIERRFTNVFDVILSRDARACLYHPRHAG
jgi:hypothetical protein